MTIEINIQNTRIARITIDGKTSSVDCDSGILPSSPLGKKTDQTFGGIIADYAVPLTQNIMRAKEALEADGEKGLWDKLTDEKLDELESFFY